MQGTGGKSDNPILVLAMHLQLNILSPAFTLTTDIVGKKEHAHYRSHQHCWSKEMPFICSNTEERETGCRAALPEMQLLLKSAGGLICHRRGSRQSHLSHLPSQTSINFLGNLFQNWAGPGVCDWHSGKAVGSKTKVAAWQAAPQIPRLPWVFWHLLALRPRGHFTAHLFKVFETLPVGQLRL